jgi:hypothetical protein
VGGEPKIIGGSGDVTCIDNFLLSKLRFPYH